MAGKHADGPLKCKGYIIYGSCWNCRIPGIHLRFFTRKNIGETARLLARAARHLGESPPDLDATDNYDPAVRTYSGKALATRKTGGPGHVIVGTAVPSQ